MGKVPSNWGHDWDISNEGAKSLRQPWGSHETGVGLRGIIKRPVAAGISDRGRRRRGLLGPCKLWPHSHPTGTLFLCQKGRPSLSNH